MQAAFKNMKDKTRLLPIFFKLLNLVVTRGYYRLRGDLIETFKIFNGLVDIKPDSIFLPCQYSHTRNADKKIFVQQSNTKYKRISLANRVAKYWNKLPDNSKNAKSTNAFKNNMDSHPKFIRLFREYDWMHICIEYWNWCQIIDRAYKGREAYSRYKACPQLYSILLYSTHYVFSVKMPGSQIFHHEPITLLSIAYYNRVNAVVGSSLFLFWNHCLHFECHSFPPARSLSIPLSDVFFASPAPFAYLSPIPPPPCPSMSDHVSSRGSPIPSSTPRLQWPYAGLTLDPGFNDDCNPDFLYCNPDYLVHLGLSKEKPGWKYFCCGHDKCTKLVLTLAEWVRLFVYISSLIVSFAVFQ